MPTTEAAFGKRSDTELNDCIIDIVYMRKLLHEQKIVSGRDKRCHKRTIALGLHRDGMAFFSTLPTFVHWMTGKWPAFRHVLTVEDGIFDGRILSPYPSPGSRLREPTMSYLCAEIRAYDELRKVVTIAFSDQWPLKPTSATFAQVSIKDCDAIGHNAEAGDTGLTSDEACVLKLLLEQGGALDDALVRPEHLVGRVCELDE